MKFIGRLLILASLFITIIQSQVFSKEQTLENKKQVYRFEMNLIVKESGVEKKMNAVVQTTLNEKFFVQNEHFKFELIASLFENESSNDNIDAVDMKAKVFKLLENGKEQLLSTPRVITKLNEPASITSTNDETKDFIKLVILPSLI